MKRGLGKWLGGGAIAALAFGAVGVAGCDDRKDEANNPGTYRNDTLPRDQGTGDTSRDVGSDRVTGGGSTGGAVDSGTGERSGSGALNHRGVGGSVGGSAGSVGSSAGGAIDRNGVSGSVGGSTSDEASTEAGSESGGTSGQAGGAPRDDDLQEQGDLGSTGGAASTQPASNAGFSGHRGRGLV